MRVRLSRVAARVTAGLLGCAALLAVSAAVANPAQPVLENEQYRFCHEDKYPLYRAERKWCKHLGETNDSCPSLPAACKAEVEPESRNTWWKNRNNGDNDGDGDKAKSKKHHGGTEDSADDRAAQRKTLSG